MTVSNTSAGMTYPYTASLYRSAGRNSGRTQWTSIANVKLQTGVQLPSTRRAIVASGIVVARPSTDGTGFRSNRIRRPRSLRSYVYLGCLARSFVAENRTGTSERIGVYVYRRSLDQCRYPAIRRLVDESIEQNVRDYTDVI